MKKAVSLLLCTLFLAGCTSQPIPETTPLPSESLSVQEQNTDSPQYSSRFDFVTEITLSDEGILVDTLDSGEVIKDSVFVTHDIIYYEDKDTYESGNPYGEGSDTDKHTPEEAAAHTVVNITKPGAYRVTGSLSAGQIRVNLGEDAYDDPNAVVELILHNADITCTVAPAILFLNTYECDGNWSVDTAVPTVDTSAAGANMILEGENTVTGSHVAKIFKDTEGEKKLWKQDGAIYSYMSLNVFGPGILALTADNEGLDTELHLTINGGSISIESGNDGINTNEDGVSVTTINGGNLTIAAGLGAEGDGIDSNGYLVINGGHVISSANPAADAGLDSDLGSFIHGGTVIALGSSMDWAESDSGQVTMNLQFAGQQKPGARITVTREDGTEIFSFENDSPISRNFSGLILSSPAFIQGETYHIYIDGVQMAYTGTDTGRSHPGGMPPGQMPDGFDPSKMEGFGEPPAGNRIPPEGFDGEMPTMPEGMNPPELPEGETFPQGQRPEPLEGGFGGRKPGNTSSGEARTGFYMNDMVNFFSGVTAA